MVHAISLLGIQHFRIEHGRKHTVLLDGQPPNVAFTVLAQLRGPKASETEVGATISIKNGERMTVSFTCFSK